MANTERQERRRPAAPLQDRTARVLRDLTVFSGQRDTYEIDPERVIAVGGESQVYFARRLSDGADVVAKIYTEFSFVSNEAQNRVFVLDFMDSLVNAEETHLLPLQDYGFLKIRKNFGGAEIEQDCPVDIMPYCPENLCRNNQPTKCTYQALRQRVLPDILQAIHCLHEANLVHRDIKPENIFLYKDRYVLGDFGTASQLTNTGMAGTRFHRGTIGYTAPEVYSGFAVSASDYFSLGCTLATLYLGEHPYREFVDIKNPNEGTFFHSLSQRGLPLPCQKGEEDLQVLVNALTTVQTENRANYKDVLLWLNDPASFCSKYSFNRKNAASYDNFEFRFHERDYHTRKELTEALTAQWEPGKQQFFRGGLNNSTLYNLLVRTNHPRCEEVAALLHSVEAEDRVEPDYDLLYAQFLYYYRVADQNEKAPFCWMGKCFFDSDGLSRLLENREITESDAIKLLSSGYLSWKLMQDGGENLLPAAEMEKLEQFARKYPELGWLVLRRRVAKGTGMIADTPDALFQRIRTASRTSDKPLEKFLSSEDSLSMLCYMGWMDDVATYKQRLNGTSALEDACAVYRLYEAVCENKQTVRKAFFRLGPYAYLPWLQQNLEKYVFQDKNARELRNMIAETSLNETQPIDQQLSSCLKLHTCYEKLLKEFQNDLVLSCLGIEVSDKTVVSDDLYAFFLEEYYGAKVPVGFLRDWEAEKRRIA